MSRNVLGEILLMGQREVIERWKRHFDEHLNGAQNAITEDKGNRIKRDKDAIQQLKNSMRQAAKFDRWYRPGLSRKLSPSCPLPKYRDLEVLTDRRNLPAAKSCFYHVLVKAERWEGKISWTPKKGVKTSNGSLGVASGRVNPKDTFGHCLST